MKHHLKMVARDLRKRQEAFVSQLSESQLHEREERVRDSYAGTLHHYTDEKMWERRRRKQARIGHKK